MATGTAFFDLTKPAGTDSVDITVLNDNFDKIDAQMQLNKENIEKDAVGSTDINPGIAGRVPAPPAGTVDSFLTGGAMWRQGAIYKTVAVSGSSSNTIKELGVINDTTDLQIALICMQTDIQSHDSASVYIIRAADDYAVTEILTGAAETAPVITSDGILKLDGQSTEEHSVLIMIQSLLPVDTLPVQEVKK